MTNASKIGDQIVTTNTDGSITITTTVSTSWGFWPTPMGWFIIAVIMAFIGLAAIYLSKSGNQSN